MPRPLWSLLFLLACAGAIPSDRCMILNKRCGMTDGNLLFSTPGFTGPECKELCRNVLECSAYTYFGANGFPFKDQCILFSYCGELDDCDDCVTASVILDCSCGSQYEGSIDYQNLVRYEEDVPAEPECRRLCVNDASCKVYTYYNGEHPTDKHLCMLLKEIQDPVKRCERCQTAPQKCEAFDECILGFYEDGEGNMMSPRGLLVTESNKSVMKYVSGENTCYKTVTGLAVGSGGSGRSGNDDIGGGGGSGYINTSQISLPANTMIGVDIAVSGPSTTVTVQSTGEILLSADNGAIGRNTYLGGDGYTGGGGGGAVYNVGGDGGTDGGDGEKVYYDGGKGSGFDISSVDMTYFQLSAGKGGKHSGRHNAGGGGGVLVDGVGPDGGDRVGEGFGGGGPGDSNTTIRSGSPGCVILEL